MPGNSNLPTENIDAVILRLLKLKSGEELDYQTYLDMIKKRLASHRMIGFKVPPEEDELLRIEFKRVLKLKDKGRFKVSERKTRVSTPPPSSGSRKSKGPGPNGPNGPNGNGRGPNGPKTKAIVKSPKGKLSTEKFFYEPGVEKVKVKDVTEKTTKVKRDKDCLCSKELQSIDKKLDSIIESLTGIDKENKKKSEKERKESERRRRGEREKGLEARPFEGIKKAISTLLKPFQSVWDIIKNFFLNIILGRIVLKLLDWFADPKNQGKIQSIVRFFGDHWPTLLALYLRFGTGLGRFVGRLGGILIKGAFKLGAWAAKLAAKAGLKGAGKFARFLGGKKGRAIATGIGIAADVAVTAGTAIGVKNLMGGGEEKEPPTQQFSGGGSVKVPRFAGGGFNFKNMLGGASLGAMFGPLGMLLGGAFGSGKPQQMFNGFVSGQKGVDKVPAMLSDGEFVMSAGAVQKYGVDTLEAMNAAGGGTNKPKMMSSKTYAAGGGYITSMGRPDRRANYDKEHGEGSYDKELARRRAKYAAQDAADIALKKKLSDWENRPAQKPSGQKKATGDKKITVNGINVTPLAGLAGATRGMGPNVTITRNTGMTPEMQKKLAEENKKSAQMDAARASRESLRKKTRAEYNRIINNPDDPRYQAAWDGTLKMSDIEKEIKAKASRSAVAPTATAAKPTSSLQAQYKAAGMGNYSAANIRKAQSAATTQDPRDRNSGGFLQPGGLFGGPRNSARMDYAQSKGKYYSSSDQKTYGNYNDAMAAKKSRMTSLESQQRLNKLSSKGAGPRSGAGIRYTTENIARFKESEKRGGILGGIGRGLTRMFGTGDQISKINAEDKASSARVKQAGAASIGRYYSSSDGKYYKDYNAAVAAKKERGASQATIVKRKPELNKIKPPSSKVKVIKAPKRTKADTIGKGSGGVTKAPSFSANHGKTNTGSKTLGVNKK